MKKIFISFFVFILMFFVNGFANAQVSSPLTSDWFPVGNVGFSAGAAVYTSLAIDSNNIPYVAFSDFSTVNGKATVMKWNGANWVNVGNAGFSLDAAYEISLAIDSNNIPYVAFEDYAYGTRVTVMKFNGANWVNVGNPGFSMNQAQSVKIALDGNNVPYVVYVDSANSNKATVMKFDGVNWVLVGNVGFSAGGVAYTSLAIGSDNIPYVGYMDAINNNKATVMKFNGANWVNVGNPGFSTSWATYISLALDGNNLPHIAYTDFGTTNYRATAMKFNGASWVNIGNPGFSANLADNISLAIDSNNIPYVTYRDVANGDKATVMKFNGVSWVSVGNPGFSAGGTSYTSIALDSNNVPYVGYMDRANGNKATVMKYITISPSLTITYPNGGEIFNAGQQFTATWTSTGIPATDELYFGLIQDETNVYYKLTGGTLNDGNEIFTVPSNIQGGQYKMYARKPSTSIDDFSDNSFTINALPPEPGDCVPTTIPWIKVLSPNGGETFQQGEQIMVKWSSCNIPASTLLEVNIFNDPISFFEFLAPNGTPNDGSETFTVGQSWLNSSNYKIIIGVPLYDPSNPELSIFDESDFSFTISSENPTLTILSPNGGEIFNAGQQFTATWTSTVFQSTDKLYFGLMQDGTNAYYILTGETPNDGTETLTIPSDVQPGQYRMHGRFIGTIIEDFSDDLFIVD